MVRYTPLSLSLLVLYFTIATVTGAPAPFYPVVNVDGGSSGAETVQVTQIDPLTMPTTSAWGESAVSASCYAFSTKTVERTITLNQAITITSTTGVTSVTTDYQTLTVTEYYTITSAEEQKPSTTLLPQKPTTVTEYKTLTTYPTISVSSSLTVTPSPSTLQISTVTVTVAPSPATITETIRLTSLRDDKLTVTDTQYLTVTPESTISKPAKSDQATPSVSEESTTADVTHYSYQSPAIVTIVQTVNAEVSSGVVTTPSYAASSSFEPSPPMSSTTTSSSPSLSSSLSSEAVAAQSESTTVLMTNSGIAGSPSVVKSSEADRTITVTQPAQTYTLIIDRSVIVTDGYTTYVTEYHTLSPSVSTTLSSRLIETTSIPASSSSPRTSTRDGTDSPKLSSPSSRIPFWSNTTTATTTTVSSVMPIATITGIMSTQFLSTATTMQAHSAGNWTFFS
ncbi:hypothetical protein V1525DRAFT_50698 [Lipomyces kononenkoae]|uniref:Uncharacterized protein n=1 Tax=Lipomyces kononenkoae TaxID=34357 RepID=A0ACC3T601_LIPKO